VVLEDFVDFTLFYLTAITDSDKRNTVHYVANNQGPEDPPHQDVLLLDTAAVTTVSLLHICN